jgi:hypothetical protein
MPNGKYKFIYGYTKAEIDMQEKKINSDLDNGMIVGDSTLVGEWAKQWFETYQSSLREHTIQGYKNAIDWERFIEYRKSSVRCKVEHVFRIIKCQFGYTKTRYKGLMKNENRLYAMFARANLYMLTMAGRSLSET